MYDVSGLFCIFAPTWWRTIKNVCNMTKRNIDNRDYAGNIIKAYIIEE